MSTGREVYIRPNQSSEKTKTGIYLPSSLQDKEKDNEGIVVLVGPGTADEPMDYKPGDIVKFNPYEGRDIIINDEELKIVAASDIYCIIEKNSLIL